MPAGRSAPRRLWAGYQFTGSCAASQARPCAATVKPGGVAGLGFVSAEAKLVPTPEPPPTPRSAQPLRAQKPQQGLSPLAATVLPSAGCVCVCVPQPQGDPQGPSPLAHQIPLPSNPPRHAHSKPLSVASQAGAHCALRRGPWPPAPSALPPHPPGTRGLRGERVCLRFPLRVNINQELMRS